VFPCCQQPRAAPAKDVRQQYFGIQARRRAGGMQRPRGLGQQVAYRCAQLPGSQFPGSLLSPAP
jgi:hypothetical protein